MNWMDSIDDFVIPEGDKRRLFLNLDNGTLLDVMVAEVFGGTCLGFID